MSPGLYIAGSEERTGKTVVAAALVTHLRQRGCRVAVMKPVEMGCEPDRFGAEPDARHSAVDGFGEMDAETQASLERLAEIAGPLPGVTMAAVAPEALVAKDARLLAHAAGYTGDLDLVNPYRFALDVDPAVAARLAQVTIASSHLRECYYRLAQDADWMVIEGMGGLMSPLAPGLLPVDLIQDLGLPVLLVGLSAPGTVSRCLLAIDALRQRELILAGVILNRSQREIRAEEAAHPDQIECFAGSVVRGILPCFTPEQLDDLSYLARRLAVHVDLETILSRATTKGRK